MSVDYAKYLLNIQEAKVQIRKETEVRLLSAKNQGAVASAAGEVKKETIDFQNLKDKGTEAYKTQEIKRQKTAMMSENDHQTIQQFNRETRDGP